MKALFYRPRRLWTALGLRGRLVAGYTALFAVLLAGIAVGETTTVRQMLIDARRNALPAATDGLTSILQGPAGVSVSGLGTTVRVVSSDPALVLALIAPDGTVLYRQVGAGAGNVDPRLLLDLRQAAGSSGDPVMPITYQRQVGATAYLVQVHSVSVTKVPAPDAGPGLMGQAPPVPGGTSTTGPLVGVPATTNLYMLVGESLRPVDDTVNALLFTTLAASALGLLLAAIIGLGVTRRALRPLARMTATAQAIAAGGDGALDQRLRLPRHGDEVGLLATTFDHMLDRIQATIAERTRSETRLRHFAADASHELRTPLAAVSGYAEVLLMGGKDDPQTAEHVLRRMTGELERMNRLVSDLLTLARLDAGLPAHARPVPVAPLLDGLAEETCLLAARAGRDLAVTVVRGTKESDALSVQADPDRLHQILLNLLHNAVKFTPDGGCITLCVGQHKHNGTVAISVADSGVGIPSEDIPLLFERFYRGDRARTRDDGAEAGGAGLGLAIAQGLAQAQGGYVEVASRPGAGSTFKVVLPAATGPSA